MPAMDVESILPEGITMPVSYLTSMPTQQSYAAKPLFESQLHFPELTAEQLPAFIENAERLLLQEQRIKLSVNGTPLPLAEMIGHSNDREGAAILKGIAEALPRAFENQSDVEVRDLAFYEAAGLIASPAFWEATEDAMKATLNRGTTSGDIRLHDAAQLGMNVTLARDGKSLECHISATWKEFTAAAKWHAMTGLEPVMKADVRMMIPLERKGGQQELRPTFVYLHANSPVPEIASKLKERKTTLAQALLNALASLPLLGRLFRGVQIKVCVGENFRGHGLAYMPAQLGDRDWIGRGHDRRLGHHLAACTHITAKRLTRRPNATRQLTGAMAAPPANANEVAPLKVLLAHRAPELRVKANIAERMDHWAFQRGLNDQAANEIAGQPPQEVPARPLDVPPRPDEMPPIGPTVEALQSQLQELQQTLEAERSARQQADTERDGLRAETEKLRLQLAALHQERLQLTGELEELNAKFMKTHTALMATRSPLVSMPQSLDGGPIPNGIVRKRAQSISNQRSTRPAAPGANTSTTTPTAAIQATTEAPATTGTSATSATTATTGTTTSTDDA